MKKDFRKNSASLSISIKILVFSAFLCALSGIMKLIAPSGTVWRIGFENFPIIFGGITMGPFVGGMVGIISDLLGCLFRGYTVNPFITLASMFVGIISAIVYKITKRSRLSVILSTFTSHLIANAVIKSLALSHMYGMNLSVLLAERIITYILTAAVECIILSILLNNKAIKSGLKRVIGYGL